MERTDIFFEKCPKRKCMSNLEYKIRHAGRDVRIFAQDGFFGFTRNCAPAHWHRLTEIHVAESGAFRYRIGGRELILRGGELLVIPSAVFHCSEVLEEGRRNAFQIDFPAEEMRAVKLPKGVACEFFCGIEAGDEAVTVAYLTLLAAYALPSGEREASDIRDRGFLIHEFFSRRYAEALSLGDLAALLRLSEKQTEREVKKHTGHSFREALLVFRMNAAESLLADGELSLSEVAERVGYASYSGFWRALRAYRGES